MKLPPLSVVSVVQSNIFLLTVLFSQVKYQHESVLWLGSTSYIGIVI